MNTTSNYNEILAALDAHNINVILPGLERMQVACERLGHPELKTKCVHVAGTNGKGSTIAFLQAILQHNGLRVGTYTSPHFHDVRERITENGRWISEVDFAQAYQQVMSACADLNLSYFEILTLMAFVHFAAQPVDILLLETGLGGRLDATNVVQPLVTILTPIDYDHQAWLGDTLEKIAAEKCGILKQNVPVIVVPQHGVVLDVIEQHVHDLHLHAKVVAPLSAEIPLGLAGEHQRMNAACAVAAARIVLESVTPTIVIPAKAGIHNVLDEYAALASTRWPGRLEWLSHDPNILCDVAHNPSGARTLVEYLACHPERSEGSPLHITILLGLLQDKDAAAMVKILAEVADHFICVTPNTPRALPAEDLANIVAAHGKSVSIDTIPHALQQWQGPGVLVVTGSFYTVSEFRDRVF